MKQHIYEWKILARKYKFGRNSQKFQSQCSRNCNTVHLKKNLLYGHISSGSEISLSKNISTKISSRKKVYQKYLLFLVRNSKVLKLQKSFESD